MKLHTAARGLAAALLAVACQVASAHAWPAQEAPASGAIATSAPKDVTIDFNHEIEPAFSSIVVSDAQGKAVTSGKSAVDAADKKRMSVALNALTPGVYTVDWVAVAADGHRTKGRYTFTVK